MFMKATGVCSSENMNLNFEQMCSMIRITYTNSTSEDRTIQKIAVDGSYGTGFHLDGNTMEPSGCSGEGGEYGITFTKGATVAAGKSEDFYILYYPRIYYGMEDFEQMQRVAVRSGDSGLATEVYPYGNNVPNMHEKPGMRYWFKVTETEEGLEWTKFLSEGKITIENQGLSAALADLYPDDVELVDGSAKFTRAFAESLTTLEINPDYEEDKYSITTLDGVEKFPYLQHVICRVTGLQECDLSKNPAIETVWVEQNALTQLNFSKNSKLRMLMCSDNPNLVSVDVADCKLLEAINVDNTALTQLKLFDPSNIDDLAFGNTSLSLNLAEFTGLRFLSCRGMKLSSLNLTTETKSQIRTLDCAENSLTELNLKEYPELRTLYCGSNNISNLNPSYSPNLSTLYCEINMLQSLDVSMLTDLRSLMCGNQKSKLTLTLNDDQKTIWDSKWVNWYANKNIKLAGEPDEEPEVLETYKALNVLGFEAFKAALDKNARYTYIELGDGMAIEEPVEIEEGREVVINLNGKYMVLINEFFQRYNPEAVFVNSGDLKISNGTIHGHQPENSTQLVDSYLFKSQNGLLQFDNVQVFPHDIKNAVYIKDGKFRLINGSKIEASNYALYLEANNYCDAYIDGSQIYGNVNLALNSQSFTNTCRLQIAPKCYIEGDLIFGGTCGNRVEGLELSKATDSTAIGANWPGSNQGGGEEPGGNQGGNKPQGGNTNGNNFWFKEF